MTDDEFDAERQRLEDDLETKRLAWRAEGPKAFPAFDDAQHNLVAFRQEWRRVGIAVGTRPSENSPGIKVTEA